MSTTIQIRIDEKTKKEARMVLEELGLDLSSGAKLFYKKVAKTRSVPFELRTVNGFTIQEELRMIRETKEALKNAKRYKSIKSLLADLRK